MNWNTIGAICVSFATVQDFASPVYQVREDAQAKLCRIGQPAVYALECGLGVQDAEVRCRCEWCLQVYFKQVCDPAVDVQPIWFLPSYYRYDNDKTDLAKEYYLKADKAIGHWTRSKQTYTDDACAKLATRMYWYDMLRNRDCRKLIADQVPQMTQYSARRQELYYVQVEENDADGVPLPIEDRIKLVEQGPGGSGT